MKITVDDMEQVMNGVKRDPPKEVLELTAKLNDQLGKTIGYQELIQMIPTMLLAKGWDKEQDILTLLRDCAGISVMAGALVGFQLGLREAGLELGIGPLEPTVGGSKVK